MKLQFSNLKLSNPLTKDALFRLSFALEEVANRWTYITLLAVKLVGSLAALVAIVSAIVVGIQWFSATYGVMAVVIVLGASTFILSVLSTAIDHPTGSKLDDGSPGTK